MITKLDKAQILKVLKAALYVALSSAISYLITATTNNPQLFGPLTIFVNAILVFIKQLFTPVKG